MNVTAQAGDTLIQDSGSRPLERELTRMASKKSLRATLRGLRKAITIHKVTQCERSVARRCLRSAPLRRARRVGVYLAMGSELRTAALIRRLQRHGTQVFAPAIVRGQLRFRALRGQRLASHPLGMAQPRSGRALKASALDVLVLPLLGFDARGNRLGQGGGYYDRALARCRFRPYRLGLAYTAQQHDTLPRDPWDQALNAVLTEHGLRRFPRSLSGSA